MSEEKIDYASVRVGVWPHGDEPLVKCERSFRRISCIREVLLAR